MFEEINRAIDQAYLLGVTVRVWSLPAPHIDDPMLVIYSTAPVGDGRVRVLQKSFSYKELQQMRQPEVIVVDIINQAVDTLLRRKQERVMVEMFSAPYYTYPPFTVEGQHNG